MSPEQAKGEPVDARSDIFSFGAVLYELATRQRAFPGKSRAATMAAVINQEPQEMSKVAPAIPHEFERIVMRCLRKGAARRHQQMSDVKVLLEELNEDTESGKFRRPRRPKRRGGGRGWRLRRSHLRRLPSVCGLPTAAKSSRRAWLRLPPSRGPSFSPRSRRMVIR
jgi:serine/threonine protein kinase